MNRKDIDSFEKINTQILGVYDEISLLSKKSPTDAVNKFKLKFINVIVKEANDYLDERYRPFDEFSQFDEDDVPQNSDVVFILAQYLQCLEKLRSDNVVFKNSYWCWKIKAEEGDVPDERGYTYVRTTKPKRLQE